MIELPRRKNRTLKYNVSPRQFYPDRKIGKKNEVVIIQTNNNNIFSSK